MQEPNIPGAPAEVSTEQALRKVSRSLLEWVELFVLALAVALLLLTFVVRHSPVYGDSMYPTLAEGDVVLVSNLFYTPARGDIVIVQSGGYGYTKPLVKRVIAVGGDTIDINSDTWEVRVNGELIDEPYLVKKSGSMTTYSMEHLTFPYTIPEGALFVMGDNRTVSADSRYATIGLIDTRYVIGRVWLRIAADPTEPKLTLNP